MKRNTGLMAAMIVGALMALPVAPRAQSKGDVALRAAIETETVKGDLKAAIAQYKALAAGADRAVAAKALVRLGECYQKQGNVESSTVWERVVREFPDQVEAVAAANSKLAEVRRAGASAPAERSLWTLPRGVSLVEGVGRFDPDGRYVAFGKTGQTGIWLHDVTTGADRPLTPNVDAPGSTATMDRFPVFSPDGRQVAYSRYGGTSSGVTTSELRVVATDGSASRVVLDTAAVARDFDGGLLYPLAWTPDRTRVCLVAYGEKSEVISPVLVSVADGSIQTLPHIQAKTALSLAFSPDGRYVVYSLVSEQRTFVTPVGGPDSVPLLDGPTSSLLLGWSADGQRVLYVSDRAGSKDLWWIRVSNGKPSGDPERLSSGVLVFDAQPPGDPQTLVLPLGFTRDGSFYYSVRAQTSDIYLADIDPATGTLVSKPERYNQRFAGLSRGARWSRDGQWLAYSAGESFSSNKGAVRPRLLIKSTRTGEEREIRLAPMLTRNAWQWLPGDRSLVIDDQSSGHTVWHSIDAQTGESAMLFDTKNIAGVPAATDLTQDGKFLFYYYCETCDGASPAKDVAPRLKLIRRELAGGAETTLLDVAGEWSLSPMPLVSPDGRVVLFSSQARGAWIIRSIPVAGGPALELFRSPVPAAIRAWTRDGRHILIAQADKKSGEQQLLVLSADGGAPVPAGLTMLNIGQMTVHPDGRRLAFSARSEQTEVRVIGNLIPKRPAAPGAPGPKAN